MHVRLVVSPCCLALIASVNKVLERITSGNAVLSCIFRCVIRILKADWYVAVSTVVRIVLIISERALRRVYEHDGDIGLLCRGYSAAEILLYQCILHRVLCHSLHLRAPEVLGSRTLLKRNKHLEIAIFLQRKDAVLILEHDDTLALGLITLVHVLGTAYNCL